MIINSIDVTTIDGKLWVITGHENNKISLWDPERKKEPTPIDSIHSTLPLFFLTF